MTPNNLTPHPEGGRFQEVFRSATKITTAQGQTRDALTHIYFELKKGELSRFHKVESDEVWNLYQGEIKIHLWDGANEPQEVILSPTKNQFCTVVPAGVWQAAEPLSDEVLVGCSVGPGFEFEDFQMMGKEDVFPAHLCRFF